jgi:hypothetical protein
VGSMAIGTLTMPLFIFASPAPGGAPQHPTVLPDRP